MQRINLTTLALCLSLSLSGCVINVGAANDSDYNGDITKVFGGIEISEHRQVSSLSTVNGGIELQDYVTTDDISTVNGSVEIGAFCNVGAIAVVNGDVTTKEQFISKGSIETVNGDIELGTTSTIDGNLVTVNGDISAANLTLSKNIETVNGNINISGQSAISGNIVFRDTEKNRHSDIPSLTLGSQVSVIGSIILEREVELDVPAHLHEKIIRKSSNM